jgi:tRNA (mo5U34)-methyltransferase
MKAGDMTGIVDETQRLREQIERNTTRSREEMLEGSWWHSIDLGDGLVTPGVHPLTELHENYRRLLLPSDLTGKRLLDVGCWDGFYSFEAERRGAEVAAVDCWRPENFFRAHQALSSKVDFQELSVYDLSMDRLGTFDIVLFLGVLYHLRHPLLGLEQICEVTRDVALISSHIIDGFYQSPQPVMEFYEVDELGGQYDNWWGPNIDCLTRMIRAAGFASAEVLNREETRVLIRASRRWNDRPMEPVPSLEIVDIVNAASLDHVFPHRGRRGFVSIRLAGLSGAVTRQDLRVEIGGFGINPVYVGPWIGPYPAEQLQINAPIPPGLLPGPVDVRVWHHDQESQAVTINLEPGSRW